MLGHRERGTGFSDTPVFSIVFFVIQTPHAHAQAAWMSSPSLIFSHLLIIALVKFKNWIISCQISCRFCAETGKPPLPHRKPHLVIHYQSSQCLKVLWPSMQLFSEKSGRDKVLRTVRWEKHLSKIGFSPLKNSGS